MKQYYICIVTNGEEKREAEKYLKKHGIAYSLSDAWIQVGDVFCFTISMACTAKQFDKLVEKTGTTRVF